MGRIALAGPRVVPLPQAYKFDNIKITDYITQILQKFCVQGAYGILAAVENSREEINPTVIFGIPGWRLVESVLPQPPSNLGLLVQDNCMVLGAGKGTAWSWSANPVRNRHQIDLRPCSVGLEG